MHLLRNHRFMSSTSLTKITSSWTLFIVADHIHLGMYLLLALLSEVVLD